MEIKRLICGDYEENCYLVPTKNGYVVIDPGDGAYKLIQSLKINVLAIFNTHGHFDHIWDNGYFDAPIYIHENDAFMLDDPFYKGHKKSTPTKATKDKESIKIDECEFIFHHFPGHTPGCCMIEIAEKNIAFSGDFLFAGCIGRYDFPYSNEKDMKNSLLKVSNWDKDMTLFPGHGDSTTLKNEQQNLNFWIKRMR